MDTGGAVQGWARGKPVPSLSGHCCLHMKCVFMERRPSQQECLTFLQGAPASHQGHSLVGREQAAFCIPTPNRAPLGRSLIWAVGGGAWRAGTWGRGIGF